MLLCPIERNYLRSSISKVHIEGTVQLGPTVLPEARQRYTTVHSCEDRISSYEGTHYNRCTQYTTYTYSTHTATHVCVRKYFRTFVLSYIRTTYESTSVLSYFRTSEIVDIVVLSYLRNMKLLRRYEGTLYFRYESTRTDGNNLSTRVFRK